jgi:hypothetical protein
VISWYQRFYIVHLGIKGFISCTWHNILMRLKYIAGRYRFSAQSLTSSGFYTHFNIGRIATALSFQLNLILWFFSKIIKCKPVNDVNNRNNKNGKDSCFYVNSKQDYLQKSFLIVKFSNKKSALFTI